VRVRQLKAARAAMVTVKNMRTIPNSYMPLLLGWSLTPVHEFLAREKSKLARLGDQEGKKTLQEDIRILFSMTNRVDELYPQIVMTHADTFDIDVGTGNACAQRSYVT